jgi:3alpha(or 20beta)-hydroxysteroid dehydrogenase
VTGESAPGPRLAGKVAIVTGGAQGIGFAIAGAFAAAGAQVMVGDINAPRGHAAVESLRTTHGDGVQFAELDVADDGSWASTVAATVEAFGGIDVLVNNAGLIHHGTLESTTRHDFQRVIDVNQIGPFLGMQAVSPVMAERRGGSIINVSSVRGIAAARGLLAYVATKFAARGMTKVAAIELGPLGIRVNSLHPGPTATEGALGDAFGDLDAIDARFAHHPLGRIGRPAEIAQVALFLASDESSYCTGAEFVADGGALL